MLADIIQTFESGGQEALTTLLRRHDFRGWVPTQWPQRTGGARQGPSRQAGGAQQQQ